MGNGNLIVANGYASVRIDNQTTYALVTGDIDVSTYRKGRIEIIDTARGQRACTSSTARTGWCTRSGTKFVQVTNAGVGQPGWVWVYDNGSGGQHGRLQRRGGEPGRPADHDTSRPKAG